MALPHGAVGAGCDCGISWSYSLLNVLNGSTKRAGSLCHMTVPWTGLQCVIVASFPGHTHF